MLEDVINALGDNKEAVASLNEFVSNNEKNISRIGTLETELTDAVARRKNLHSIVSKATGLTEITEDALTNFAKNADAEVIANAETVQNNYLELKKEYDGLEAKHESELSQMILKDTLRGLGIGDMVQNDMAFKQLTELVLQDAVRDGATFTFKQDGKTRFNGSTPMNVEDRIAELRESEFSYLFKAPQGGGGGGDSHKQTPKQQTKLQSAIQSTLSSMAQY